MKKFFYSSLFFALPVIILIGSVIYNKYFNDKKSFSELHSSVNVNKSYIKLKNDWLTNQFSTFYGSSNFIEKVSHLDIKYTNCEKSELSTEELYDALDKVLRILVADNYDTYYSLRLIGQSFLIDSNIANSQMGILQKFHGVDFDMKKPMFPDKIHKLYWEKETENGKNASLWQSICWEQSWVECWKVQNIDVFTDIKAFTDKLLKTVPNCGILGMNTIFKYSPSPKEIISKNKEIQGATAYFLFKTSEEKAYPLIFQFYFDPSGKIWFPTHLAVAYVGERKYDPVF